MSSKGKVTAALVRAEAVTVRVDLSTFSSNCMGDEDVHLQHHILVLLSLGYCDGGKSEAATARAARLMSDLETEPPELSSVVVARGAGFEELFGPLANSLPLRPSSYVHVCCVSAPDGFVVHGSPCLFPSARRISFAVNEFVDAQEVSAVDSPHEDMRSLLLEALLEEGTPYFETKAALVSWLEHRGIPVNTIQSRLEAGNVRLL
jgi:hypothetical protein